MFLKIEHTCFSLFADLFANSDMVQENQNPSSVSIPPSDNQLSNTDEGEQIESNKVDKAHETTV